MDVNDAGIVPGQCILPFPHLNTGPDLALPLEQSPNSSLRCLQLWLWCVKNIRHWVQEVHSKKWSLVLRLLVQSTGRLKHLERTIYRAEMLSRGPLTVLWAQWHSFNREVKGVTLLDQ